jgi:hypothetical protein
MGAPQMVQSRSFVMAQEPYDRRCRLSNIAASATH